ncbi:unnamed protein product [Caenorhabditis sp. 36 PRJEB53466]|nr:unnamed protein product [Caenorhabditis sp. 36 PRJEB53466]
MTRCIFILFCILSTAHGTIFTESADQNHTDHRFFLMSLYNNTTNFDLVDNATVVFQLKIDELWKQTAYFYYDIFRMVVNSSNPVALFVSDCEGTPISVKPIVTCESVEMKWDTLGSEDGCVFVNISSINAPSTGVITIEAIANTNHIHSFFIFLIVSLVIIATALLNYAANEILRGITSYQVIEENTEA